MGAIQEGEEVARPEVRLVTTAPVQLAATMVVKAMMSSRVAVTAAVVEATGAQMGPHTNCMPGRKGR